MKKVCAIAGLCGVLVANAGNAQDNAENVDTEFDKILSLDIAELIVTSVSKTKQKLSDVASAVYVLTHEDLHRAGITSIPEALRMVPGLQVAQIDSYHWAVSARGFNQQNSNKLLVMIDGRSLYTPVFSGVYWDTADTLIEDIDRIEIIRGPGATLWGANAVNGVINIITKKASETKGTYLSQVFGTQEYSTTEGRHGGSINKNVDYRVYAKQFHRGKTDPLLATQARVDDWARLQSGFRIDGKQTEQDSYTVSGDVYSGEQGDVATSLMSSAPFSMTQFSQDKVYGGNLTAEWTHQISFDSSTILQMFLDHYARDEGLAQQEVNTVDVDFQHSLNTSERNQLIWGLGYRVIKDSLEGGFTARVVDEKRIYDVFNAFIQNQYALVPGSLFVTLGSKFEYNDFTGFEFQPSARIAWKATDNQTIWAAVSRAVRVPSRAEEDLDLAINVTPGTPNAITRVFGSETLQPEELTAYEVGYRIQPYNYISFDLATYFNQYDNLSTIEPGGAPFLRRVGLIVPYTLDDRGQGNVYGAEAAVNWNVNENWKLISVYNIIKMDLETEEGSITNLQNTEDQTPGHQFSIRSYWNVTPEITFDNMLYYVDDLKPNSLQIAENIRFDTHVGWNVMQGVELELIGRNLFNADHPEFSGSPTARIGATYLGKVSLTF